MEAAGALTGVSFCACGVRFFFWGGGEGGRRRGEVEWLKGLRAQVLGLVFGGFRAF